jgi:hypothetical protein
MLNTIRFSPENSLHVVLTSRRNVETYQSQLWLQGRDRGDPLIGFENETQKVDFPGSNNQSPNGTMSGC